MFGAIDLTKILTSQMFLEKYLCIFYFIILILQCTVPESGMLVSWAEKEYCESHYVCICDYMLKDYVIYSTEKM